MKPLTKDHQAIDAIQASIDKKQQADKAMQSFSKALKRKTLNRSKIGMKKYNNEVNDKAKKKPGVVIPGVIPASPTPFDKIEKPMFPRTFRYMMSKFTLNGLFNTLQGVPHVGMFNSDAAEFFNSHSFKDETTSVEIVSAMSRLWSGENIDKIMGVEDMQTRGKRTTALFMLQQ